jgi:hypothetical protein
MLNLDSFSAGFLQTGQSYKFGFSELEVYKAVAGDLTNPAKTCQKKQGRQFLVLIRMQPFKNVNS